MRRSAAAVAAGFLAALTLHAPMAPAQEDAPSEEAAVSLVGTLVEESHEAMAANDTEALKAAVSRAFAFDVWERFMVGDAELSAEQREAFRGLLPGFLANLYAERFGKGLEAAPEVVGARPIRRDILVKARIPRADAEPLPVEYRVRGFEERGPQVIDIMVGGVSFLVLKRDEFGAILERGGADALLDFMRGNAI